MQLADVRTTLAGELIRRGFVLALLVMESRGFVSRVFIDELRRLQAVHEFLRRCRLPWFV